MLGHVDAAFLCTTERPAAGIIRMILSRQKSVATSRFPAGADGEIRDLATLARRGAVALMTATVSRHIPERARWGEAARDGIVGAPAVLRIHRHGVYSLGTGRGFRTPSVSYLTGELLHDLDLACWVAGRAVSTHASFCHKREGGDQASALHLLVTHESGAISMITAEGAQYQTAPVVRYELAATDGTLSRESTSADGYQETPGSDRPPMSDAEDLVIAAMSAITQNSVVNDIDEGAELQRMILSAMSSPASSPSGER